MPFDVDPIRLERIFLIGALLGLLVAGLGVAGELLGWWNDVGEILVTTGTLASVVLGLGFGLANASRRQVAAVREAVEGNTTTLETNGTKLDDVHEAIVGEEGVVSELDLVQAELDAQTGVLKEQLKVLDRIDGRLDG